MVFHVGFFSKATSVVESGEEEEEIGRKREEGRGRRLILGEMSV